MQGRGTIGSDACLQHPRVYLQNGIHKIHIAGFDRVQKLPGRKGSGWLTRLASSRFTFFKAKICSCCLRILSCWTTTAIVKPATQTAIKIATEIAITTFFMRQLCCSALWLPDSMLNPKIKGFCDAHGHFTPFRGWGVYGRERQ